MVQPPCDEADIFGIARAINAPEARAAYLRQACGDDAALHDRVVALLKIAEDEQSFLEHPPAAYARTVNQPLSEAVGTAIGPYKLLEQIGEGGFGIVYMADQQAPVRRRVALKIIKPGMDTRQVLARFEAELQALSLMDHPNIARALDAGATDSGRPYFVMELVRGVPITDYCDQNNLAVHERLDLFVQVCHAVQHAHQKGIIHRDIKPSNVLVTLHDGRAVPKVIDFGVAKAIDRQLTPETIFTRFAEMIGTPLYMSPEQAEMTSLDIDTRSDIYSLGVLLYELLTGTTPFEKERLKNAAYDEIRRIIREEEPAKPSTRISTLNATSAATAAHRHADPRRLSQLMRGDLDWIVMKALEKDRTRRYETANGLAMDLQRHLADEPVLAGPPSAVYRFHKFARRNRAALAMVAVVTVALLLGIVGTTWQAVRATSQRDRAVTAEGLAETRFEAENHARAAEAEQRLQAEANFQKARQAVDEMYTQVAEQWLARQPKLEPLQREFLQKALRFYEEFAQKTSPDPAVRLEAAQAYRRVADIQHKLGAPAEAERAFERAIDGLQKLADEFPAAPEYRQNLADTLHKLGVLLGDTGRYAENEIADRRALALQEKLVTDFPGVPEYRRDLGQGYRFLGDVMGALQHKPEREKAYRSALAIHAKLVAEFPSVPDYRQHLASAHAGLGERREAAAILEKLVVEFPTDPVYRNELANVYFWQAYDLTSQEGEPILRKALALQRRLADDFPAVTNYRYDLGRSLEALASKLQDTNRTEEAERSLREAAAIADKLAADSPTVFYYRGRLHKVYGALAILLTNMGRLPEAEAVDRQARENYEKFVAEFPAVHGPQAAFGHNRRVLAFVLWNAGQRQAAEGALHEALIIFEKLTADFPTVPDYWHYRADTLRRLAGYMAATDRAREAENAYRQAIELQEKLKAEFPGHTGNETEVAANYSDLAALLSASDRREEAEKLYRHAIDFYQKLVAESPANPDYRRNLAVNRQAIARLLSETGRKVDAETTYRDALALWEKLVAESPSNPDYRRNLAVNREAIAGLLSESGRKADAETTYRDALALWEKLVAESPTNLDYRWHLAVTHDALGRLLKDAGRLDDAAEAYRHASALWEKLSADSNSGDHRNHLSWTRRWLIETLLVLKKHAEVADLSEALVRELPDDGETMLRSSGNLTRCARLAAADESVNDAERSKTAQRYASRSRELFVAASPKITNPWTFNNYAWGLVTAPSTDPQDALNAIELMKIALEKEPKNSFFWNTLGVAHYRAGQWQPAIDALEKSNDLSDGHYFGTDAFFLAMAHWQAGLKERAHQWHTLAVLWTDKHGSKNEEMTRFRAEAAALLGPIESPPAVQQPAPNDDVAILARIIEDAPQAAWAYSQRGQAYAEQARWDEAAADFAKAVELQRTRNSEWYMLSIIHLARHAADQHRVACSTMLDEFAGTGDPNAAHFAAWSCALGPDALTDFAPAIALAEKAAKSDAKSSQFVSGLGAILYRAGRFDEARQKLEEADGLTSPADPRHSPPAYTWFFLAMTHHRIGNADEAKKWLDKAREVTDKAQKEHDAGTATLPWNRRLTLTLLRREAEELIELKQPPAPETKQQDGPAK